MTPDHQLSAKDAVALVTAEIRKVLGLDNAVKPTKQVRAEVQSKLEDYFKTVLKSSTDTHLVFVVKPDRYTLNWTGRRWKIVAHGVDQTGQPRSIALEGKGYRSLRLAKVGNRGLTNTALCEIQITPIAPVRYVSIQATLERSMPPAPSDTSRPGVLAYWQESWQSWIVSTPDDPYYSITVINAEWYWSVDDQTWKPYAV